MIRIPIAPAAFDAIAAALPLGSVGFAPALFESGESLIRLKAAMIDRLGSHARAGPELLPRHPAAGRAGGKSELTSPVQPTPRLVRTVAKPPSITTQMR
jgi:hypothetical protein